MNPFTTSSPGDTSSENSVDSLKKSRWRDQFYFALTGLCILVSLGTIVLCIVLWSKLSLLEERLAAQDKKIHIASSASNRASDLAEQILLCEPCSSLVLGPFLDDEPGLNIFIKKIVRGENYCCSTTTEQTGYMVQLMVKRKVEEEISKVLVNCSKSQETLTSTSESTPVAVYAHLLAGRQNITGSSSTSSADHLPPVRNWLTSNGLSLLNRLHVRNDRIVVSEKGIYLVYSHVQFTELLRTSESVAPTSQKLSHKVCRHNIVYPNGGEQCLMEATMTKCWDASKRLEDHPSYLAGVFSLEANDNIYVRVSNTTLLPLDPISTFFGIVKFS